LQKDEIEKEPKKWGGGIRHYPLGIRCFALRDKMLFPGDNRVLVNSLIKKQKKMRPGIFK
jgi:hypothetical protein